MGKTASVQLRMKTTPTASASILKTNPRSKRSIHGMKWKRWRPFSKIDQRSQTTRTQPILLFTAQNAAMYAGTPPRRTKTPRKDRLVLPAPSMTGVRSRMVRRWRKKLFIGKSGNPAILSGSLRGIHKIRRTLHVRTNARSPKTNALILCLRL